MSRSFTATRWVCVLFIGAVALLASACVTSPGGGVSVTTTTVPYDGPLTIAGFSAQRTSAPAPLTTAFSWTLLDPGSAPLTCGLDFDDDGTYELLIASCTSSTVRSATFATPGTHTVRLGVTDGTTTVTSDVVSLSVGAASADPFAITVRFNGTLTTSQESAFASAASRWEQVVLTGLADLPVNVAADFCGTGAPAFSGTVDDLLIDASIEAIDGAGGVLASAGPCLTRTAGGLPIYGAMKFDTADVVNLQVNGQLEAVILHEMGHVLGFGTVWDSLLAGKGTSNPRYTGLTGRGAWSAVFGGSGLSVPVENIGGPGTADSHWRESVLDKELMTGYLDSGANPLSEVTVGALADLGYGVDLEAADPFGTPALRAQAGPPIKLETQLIYPSGQLDG